jgi:predicted O-methyltransferase YrrM
MEERQVSRWARRRVASHLLAGTVNPRRARSAATAMYRALKSSAARLHRASLASIFPGIERTEVRVRYSPDQGGGSLADVITLAQAVKYLGCRRMFEIGTFRGHTTFHLALNAPPGSHVYTLDLPAAGVSAAKLALTDLELIQKSASGEWFHNTECQPRITQLFGDSAAFDYSAYQGKMDFVFIDGGHSYEYAMADSLTARSLLDSGGTVLWHDYPTYPGVWRCLEELSGAWPGRFAWVEGTALVVWKPDWIPDGNR